LGRCPSRVNTKNSRSRPADISPVSLRHVSQCHSSTFERKKESLHV
jgi:hypothetical protein